MECVLDKQKSDMQARLSGQFVFSDHPAFKEIIDAAGGSACRSIALDFSRLEFIDSAGLGMLLLLRDVCHKNRKKLTLHKPKGQVKRVFNISKFEHLFTVEE